MQIKNMKYCGRVLALALTTGINLCGCGNTLLQQPNIEKGIEVEKEESFNDMVKKDLNKLTSIALYYYDSSKIYNINGLILTAPRKTTSITGREKFYTTIKNIIESASNLENVTICSGKEEDFELLAQIKDKDKIKSINISCEFPFQNLDFLNSFPNLEELTINVKVLDLTALNNLKNLRSLTITPFEETKLPALDLPELQNLKIYNSRYFYMGGYTSKDFIDSLANHTNLKTLFIHNLDLSDFDFSNLVNLQSINLKNAQISDISSLENLKFLTNVQLENNKISNVTPLYKLPRLKITNLKGNLISRSMFDQLVMNKVLTEEEAAEVYETQKNRPKSLRK